MILGWPKKKQEGDAQGGFFYLRIDDRLIHGQVVIGWALPLKLDSLILADDRVALSPAEREFYLQIIPESMAGQVLSLDEAIQTTPKIRRQKRRSMIVVSTIESALKWVNGENRPDLLILGGIHSLPGRKRLLDYVYLADMEIQQLRNAVRRGVRVVCQDVATSDAIDFEAALSRAD